MGWRVWSWCWLLASGGALAGPYVGGAGVLQVPTEVSPPAPTKTPAPPSAFVPAWNPEGEEFSVYGLARDAIVTSLARARTEVVVVAPFLADGDVATALLAARIRGLRVRVLLDVNRTSAYLSRHAYLAENRVETFLKPLKGLQGWTTLVLDGSVWELSTALDDRVRGSVRLVPSPRLRSDVETWFDKGRIVAARAEALAPAGAKNPTRRRSASEPSATIEESKTVVRRSYRNSRGLPRETRARLLESGALLQEPGAPATRDSAESLLRKPEVSSREAELP